MVLGGGKVVFGKMELIINYIMKVLFCYWILVLLGNFNSLNVWELGNVMIISSCFCMLYRVF